MSWEVAAILYAISAIEGVRRLQPDEVVLRCGPLGGWRVVSPVRLWRSWYLVSILAPFFLTIVPRGSSDASVLQSDRAELRSFATSIEPILTLRVLGALDLVVVVLGIPWGVSKHGSTGLIAFFACALALSAAITLRSASLPLMAGESRKVGFRKAISFLSPFASPLAAEAALSARAQTCSRLAVMLELLDETKFRAMVRSSVYDIKSRGSAIGGSCLEEIALALPDGERTRILDSAGEGCTAAQRFCPRCAERYSPDSTTCADCEGIALVMPMVI